jgi:plastocyanin
MKPRLAPLTVLFLLALPATALGANANVKVADDEFQAPTVQINPGDTVTWDWTGVDQHTVTARSGQTERFGSKFMTSGTFQHTFPKPGRFTYICQVHSFMRGAVEVGPPPFPDTLLPRATSVKAKVTGSTAKIGFRLSEKSRVKVAVSGRTDKVTSRLVGKGKHSYTFRHLKAGKYRFTLSLRDLAKNKGRSVTKSFRVS